MSKNRSPADGAGSEASPRSGSISAPGGQEQLVLAAGPRGGPRAGSAPARGRGPAPLRRAVERRRHRQGEVAERLERRDAALARARRWRAADPGDEAQVVVVAAPGHAFGRPATDVAMLDRLRVGRRRRVGRGRLVRDRREEPVAGAPVVGHVVVDAQALDGPGAAAERDVEPLGPDALDPLELVDVRADLEDRAGLDVAGELRVGDLVVVRAPARWAVRRVDAEQEVGVAAERAVEERRLVDDVRAGGHGLDGRGRRGPELLAAVRDGAVQLDLDRRARPSARRSARKRASCWKPRLRMTSSSGSSRIGRLTRPARAARSSWVRCSQAR